MRYTIAAGLMALTAAGCSTAGHTATSTAPTAPTTPRAAAKPSTAAGPAPLGTTQTRAASDITLAVTVYHAQPVKSHSTFGEPSRRIFGIDIRVCVRKLDGSTTLGQMAWSVDYADDTTANPIGEWWNGEFTEPLYPVQKRVVAGQCVRGWIMFTPLKGRATRVTYAPDDTEPAFWRIP